MPIICVVKLNSMLLQTETDISYHGLVPVGGVKNVKVQNLTFEINFLEQIWYIFVP